MEERKFVCKYCNKKYPCGKSLGGHIRTHMTTEHSSHSSPQSNEVRTHVDDSVIKFDGGRKRKRDVGSEEVSASASGNPIYGLRENPKKTTRFVHSNAALQQERFCKECGKGFLSLKALCGHMACHSEKDKGTTNKFENNSGFTEKQQKLVMDSQSDTETSAPSHPRRSRRMRFRTLSSNNNNNNNPPSSSVSEVEQEQEEIARCLMLLSKDSSHKGRFILPTESSDNNSVVLEAKSPSVDTRITFNNGKKSCVSNGFEIVEEEEKKKKKKVVHKDMKLKSAEVVCSDNSDSGYFRNGPKKLDSDVSIDGFHEFKTPKVEVGAGFEFHREYDAESRKKMMLKNREKTRSTEPRKLVLEELDCDTTDGGARRNKFINSRKRASYDSLSQNYPMGVSWKKTSNGSPNEGSWKQESLNSEKVINGSFDSAYESDESSTDTDAYPAPKTHSSKAMNGKKTSKSKKKLKSKKSRDHECPICCKIFRSGQALGGHKRSHFVGGAEENTLVIKQGSPVVPCLIDLNLPAPVDD